MNLAPILICALSNAPQEAATRPAAEFALPSPDPAITAEALEHHVRFLASDELRGREAGTPDAVRAAQYLARVLEQSGLTPAGDDGTFLQTIPLVRFEHREDPELTLKTGSGETVTPIFGEGFSLSIRDEPRSTGALQLTVADVPEDMPATEDAGIALALPATRSTRSALLEGRGLSADGAGFGLLVVPSMRSPRSRLPRPRLSRASEGPDAADIVTLYGELGERLTAGEFTEIELTVHADKEELSDYNVVGRIEGTHAEMGTEAVVITAHYDHIGVTEGHTDHGDQDAEGDDTIYNGADDDASGTAAVLELAEAFAAGDPPARTLVFMLAAGEERGLLGTYYYLDHPVVPLERTVANLNFEMIGRPDALVGGAGKMWLTGYERTNLGPAFQEHGIEVAPDGRPEQRFFSRSDNYAFVLRGIVGQTLSTYDLHEDYHRVTDEADTLDYPHMETCVRTALEASRLLADGTLTPEWLPGGKPESR